jgi:hypothetical protein
MNEREIDILIEGQREAEAAHAARAKAVTLEHEALDNRHAAYLESAARGREAADEKMKELGGWWPADMRPEPEHEEPAHESMPLIHQEDNLAFPATEPPPD